MTNFPRHLAFCVLGLATAASLALAAETPATPAAKTEATAPVFSEDFESGAINKAVWDTRAAGGAEVKVQSAQVHSGKSAVQIHYAKGATYDFIVATHLPDSVRTHLFGRAYVFISPGMPAGHDVLIATGTPGWPISNFLEIGLSGGKNVNISYQQNDTATPPRAETSVHGPAYPVGKWFCLEWELNNKPDSITVWIDGEQVAVQKNISIRAAAPRAGRAGAAAPAAGATPAVPATTTAAAPAQPATAAATPAAPAVVSEKQPLPGNLVRGFSDFAFGFRAWGAGAKADYDLYYDDIVIDTKRIGPMK